MKVPKILSASSSSPSTRKMLNFVITSATWMATWMAIVGSCSCHNAYAFAFTKIPDSLLDGRHFHRDRRTPKKHLAQSALASRIASNRIPNNRNINRNRNSSNTKQRKNLPSLFLSAEAQEEGSDSKDVTRGRLLLGLVAMLYGSLNVSLRFVYDVPKIPPKASALSATRGWLAFLCFLPPLFLRRTAIGEKLAATNNSQTSETTPPTTPTTTTTSLFASGLELAVWGFLAQGLLNVGLLSTGSARASFLTQTSVLFTPLISTSIGNESIGKKMWLACLVALTGLVVLTLGAGGGAFAISLSRGDLFVMGGALSWSMYLFRISSLGPKHPGLVLQGVKTGLMAILYSMWWMTTTITTAGGVGKFLGSWGNIPLLPSWMASGWAVWIGLFFSAVGPGTIADVLQQTAQRSISPSEANILLSAEPIFATIFAVLLLGERSSLLEIIGGALILGAAVVASA